MVFPQCEFSYGSSSRLKLHMQSHIVCIYTIFSRISFQMRPQTACMNRCKVALATFMWIFPRVSFLMVRQVAWSYMCKVTLFTFVRYFTRMSFQMCPKIARMNRCKVALATCMRFFPCVSFLMVPQVAWSNMCKVTLIAFVWFFSRDAKLHWLHLCYFPLCEFSHGSLSCLKLQMQRWFSPISKILSCLISAPDVVQHSYEVFWLDPQVLLFWGFSVRQHILPNQWHFNYLSCLDRCSHIVYILRFFSRMSFQMCPKIARMNRCKVALATCMRFFISVSFLMVPQVACPEWVFKCALKLPV